jgi:Fe2+ or Zn2+ uptake regulation protein
VQIDPTTLLRERGIYVTAQRLAVLRVVGAQPHAAADRVLQGVREEIGSISRQSVYDTLNTLTDLGLLRRIQPTASPARYEARTGDNHHHLICRVCGRVEDVDCAVGERPCLTASDAHSFDIDEAEVLYWGHCPDCRQEPDSASPIPQHTHQHPHQGEP